MTSILRMRPAAVKVGCSRSNLYEKINPKSKYFDPTFPKPVSLGARSIGFLENSLDTWIESRVAACGKSPSARSAS